MSYSSPQSSQGPKTDNEGLLQTSDVSASSIPGRSVQFPFVQDLWQLAGDGLESALLLTTPLICRHHRESTCLFSELLAMNLTRFSSLLGSLRFPIRRIPGRLRFISCDARGVLLPTRRSPLTPFDGSLRSRLASSFHRRCEFDDPLRRA